MCFKKRQNLSDYLVEYFPFTVVLSGGVLSTDMLLHPQEEIQTDLHDAGFLRSPCEPRMSMFIRCVFYESAPSPQYQTPTRQLDSAHHVTFAKIRESVLPSRRLLIDNKAQICEAFSEIPGRIPTSYQCGFSSQDMIPNPL